MKRREGKGAPSADLLVCFPTRAHLTLMPKTICSPARPSGPNKNSHNHQQYSHHHHLRKSSTRGSGASGGGGGGHASPYLWSKTKQMGSDYSEPTSPKVTCAGQIKVRPRPGPCKSWQSVMEEIERLHNNKQKKRPTWVEALGFKKEMMQFLTCLRSVRFDFRCFGTLPNANVTSDDDEDEDEEEDDEDDEDDHQQELDDQEGSSKAVFSKWFMVLQENQNSGIQKAESCKDILEIRKSIDDPQESACGPPPNALLLMRCRSAPAKSWQEEKEEEEEEENDADQEMEEKKKLEEELERKQKLVMEEEEKEKKKKRESLEDLMRYESDFYKFSSDIAKETWVVGGIKDILSRSRSTKR